MVLLFLLAGAPAQAHLLNMTRVLLAVDPAAPGSFELTVDIGQSLLSPADYLALARAAGEEEQSARLAPILAALETGVIITLDGQPLPRRFTAAQFDAESLEAIANPLTPQMATLRWELPALTGEQLELSLAPGFELPWPWLVRIDSAPRELPSSRLLTPDRRATGVVPLGADDAGSTSSEGVFGIAWVYTGLGILHIFPDGLDHVLFILGLFLVGGTFRELLILVSCFTIAHTVTLGAAILGFISPPAQIVEALIAASIVYVGLEALFGFSKVSVRYTVVFAFGLLHGLGFASVLGAIGLPDGQYVHALLAFNVGVELGQLLVLASAFLLFGAFRGRRWYAACIVHPGAMIVAGVGVYWLLERL